MVAFQRGTPLVNSLMYVLRSSPIRFDIAINHSGAGGTVPKVDMSFLIKKHKTKLRGRQEVSCYAGYFMVVTLPGHNHMSVAILVLAKEIRSREILEKRER